uniref:Aquaporin n=1 Tax=Romanomermis culicivorax TaxID=13658 RepID=A0A915L8K0_ROMCU
MNLGWGCGIAIAFCVCGGVSGGHINPAITFCFAVLGRIKWLHVPAYMAGQYVGAFLGSWAIFIVYY